MNITQRGIVTLLKSAVTGQSLPLPEGFSLEEACPLIRRHRMVTLAYDGAVRCKLSPREPAMNRLFSAYCKALLISERQMEQVARVSEAFEEKGIDYMPLKGCKMKALYPAPELRAMGDADILIRVEQCHRIEPILTGLGFEKKDETDHELVWVCDGLYLELHKRLIPSYNADFFAYFGDGWQRARRQRGSCFSLSAEDEWLFLFAHFAKHYRDGGIGCRHLVDLWVYLQANPGMDGAYIGGELEKLQLAVFYRNICRLLDVWFGDAPMDEMSAFLTEKIFASGSFGQAESHAISQTVRDSGAYPAGVSRKLIYFLEKAFPGAQTLQGRYRVLKKALWLLPLVWLYRPIHKWIFERKTLRRELRNLKTVDRRQVEARREELRYVGLEYRF